MYHTNTAEKLDFEELGGRLGLAFNPRGPKPVSVTLVFYFDEDDNVDKKGRPILHFSKAFLNEEDAIRYCKDYENLSNLVWETHPVQ